MRAARERGEAIGSFSPAEVRACPPLRGDGIDPGASPWHVLAAMSHVIMVKKLLESGEACAKCGQAEQMLRKRGVWDRIDEVVWAEEGKPDSAGMRLAAEHGVDLAPFFLVSQQGRAPEVFTSTMKLIRALSEEPTAAEPRAAGAIGDEEIAELEASLRGQAPEQILRWGLERFGAGLGVAFSGAEDVALIHMASESGLPFRVFCLDTGRLHAETYAFIEKVRTHYGIEIDLMAPQSSELEPFVRQKGLFSFYEEGHAECCSIRKIEPLRRALRSLDAWATGQRRDQSPTRAELQVLEKDRAFSGRGQQLLKLNPLAHFSSEQVWRYLRDHRVPYNELHDAGYVSIGCQPCTRAARPGEHERAARWWWEESTKRECGLHTGPAAR